MVLKHDFKDFKIAYGDFISYKLFFNTTDEWHQTNNRVIYYKLALTFKGDDAVQNEDKNSIYEPAEKLGLVNFWQELGVK